jgi:hypothetical protein
MQTKKMNGAKFDIARYLNAKFPGHVRRDVPQRLEWAAATAAKAFPDLGTPLEYFFIRSSRRHCAKFEVAGSGGIIMDDGLSDLMALGDLLLLDESYADGSGLVFASIQFTEAFHQEADAERTIVCAAAVMREPLLLHKLRQRAANTPGRSAAMLFLLLHEIGHFAIDNRSPFAVSRIEDMRRMVASLIKENENAAGRLKSGDSLSDFDTSIGPGPSPERDTMVAQILSYIDLIRDDEELVREASCDFVALTGLTKLRLANSVDVDRKTVSGVSYREFGDALFIALRAIRLLVAQELIRRTAESVVAGTDPSALALEFARHTARFNIVTNLASEMFDSVVKGFHFDTPHRPDDPGKKEDPVQLFRHGIRLVHERSVKRIFDPIEQLGQFFRDTESYTLVTNEFMLKQFGVVTPSLDQMEELADRLIAAPPI